MTVLWQAARVFVVVGVLLALFAVLPEASAYDTADLTIPDVVWDPLVGVLSLNRYLPIVALLVIASFDVTAKAGMAALWLGSWVLRHVLG